MARMRLTREEKADAPIHVSSSEKDIDLRQRSRRELPPYQ